MAAMAAFTFSSCEDVPAPYTMPEKPADGGAPTTGKGSESDPYTVAEAIEVMKAGTAPTTEVHLSGIISKVISYNETYKSISYNISDNGKDENTIQVYSGKGLNGADFSSKDDLKVGQKVLVKGIIKIFTKTDGTVIYEVDKTSSIIKIEGEGNTPAAGEAKGTGTEADPFNSVAANNYTKALEAGKVTDQNFYIKGKIQSIKDQFSAQFGNASVYIADDANSEQFYVFRIYYFGGEKWKEGDMTLKEGDEIVVCAKLINYMGNTPETNQGGKLISVNGKTNGEGGGTVTPNPEPEPDPTPGDIETGNNGDFEAWAEGKPTNWNTNSAGNATLKQSNDAHTGKYSVQVAGSPKANKRLGYKEMKLKAGKYTLKFYAKAATATGASVCPGHVAVKDGVVDSQNYVYTKQYVSVSNTEWTLVEQEIEIAADGTYSIVIMNAKKPGGDVLIDDFTVTLKGTAIIK